jgi:hypothetical protein
MGAQEDDVNAPFLAALEEFSGLMDPNPSTRSTALAV